MSQSVFAKSVGCFALGKVEACTGSVDLMIDGLAVGLAGNIMHPKNWTGD
jgi:hypothetical protein